ncbi:transcriptional regulator [Brachybacterium alimentarium]|uniref:transcriptional regulator n=1 Tax=Brachybacterium alimentarium TaxID=47845 RepID=UPI000DF4B8A7|nr:transcriptional regulator [Brachybacterium alimentarium]RCS77788.1 transcriptional regulator [Brachybacterium alimentarium]
MTALPPPYDAQEPITECKVSMAPEIPTAVVSQRDFPMYEMPALMDGVFSHLITALEEMGIHPSGPAFSLHHRAPVSTADLEVGFPVDTPLTETLELPSGYEVVPSVLPGGRIAWRSHIGGYGGLAESWGAFTEEVGESEEQMTYPFWEFYVTPPMPDINPATLRTDLFSLLEPREV